MKRNFVTVLFVLCLVCSLFMAACSPTVTENENVLKVTIDGVVTYVWKGEKAALPEPKNSDENKVFVEWQTEDGKTFDPQTPLERDTTIVSVWRDKYTYTLTFDSQSYQVKEGATFKAPVPEPRDGFKFAGWFAGSVSYSEQPVYANATYTSRWIKTESDKDFSAQTYTELGRIGGTNTAPWDGFVARDNEGIYFRFVAEQIAAGSDGVGLFLNVGERTGTARNGATFLIRISVSGMIEINNYPNNSKQTLITGEYQLGNGIFTQSETKEDKTVLQAYIPYSFFGGVDASYETDSGDVIALTLTGEDFETGKYDVWFRSDMLGADKDEEVDRMNLADYLRISYGGVLFESDSNEADTFLSGNAGQADVLVTCNGVSTVSGSDGQWNLAVLCGGEPSVELSFEKKGYQTTTKTVALSADCIEYTVEPISLESIVASVNGILKDYVSGNPITGAQIESAYGTVESGADGSFVIEGVKLAEGLLLTVTAQNYGEFVVEYTATQLTEEGFVAEVILVADTTEFTITGNVEDIFGTLEGVEVSNGVSTVSTLADGSFELVVMYGNVTLTFSKDGYISQELTVTRDQLLSGEEFTFTVGKVELMKNPVSLGTIGGDKVEYIWNGTASRNSQGLYFEFKTENVVPKSDTIGVGIFLNMDEQRFSGYRTERTYLIGLYTSGKITVYNYPNTSKKAATLEEISCEVIYTENSVEFKIFIPYQAFVANGISVNAMSDFGISMTADFDSKTWDVWMRSDLLGMDGDAEVDRENSLDYLVLDAHNTLSEYDVTMDKAKFQTLAEAIGALQENKSLFENIAQITTDSATTIEKIASGQLLFSDRTNFRFSTMIEAVEGMNFTYSTIANGPKITVSEAGYLILIMPATGSYSSLRTAAEKDGWNMVLQGYNATGVEKLTEKMNYYVKWCEEGKSFEYGKWHFFIL